jgi:glutathione peroxidase
MNIAVKVLLFLSFLLNFEVRMTSASKTQITTHDFSFTKGDGTSLNLSDYKGKVIMIVNVASKCGFTKQYAALQEIYQKYKDYGFVIIAVPSNDFADQEPGDYCEIKDFAHGKFNVSFEIVQKEHVSGSKAHKFFKWVSETMPFYAVPKWNFYKYLIDKNGNIAHWFFSATEPNSFHVTDKIEILLEQKYEG